MKKLLMFTPKEGTPPLSAFLKTLDPKLCAKLESLFVMLAVTPVGLLHEPYVKHFSIERYNTLYELRAKSKILVRIIFSVQPDGNVLFLAPFIKAHKRNTMQALDASLKMLSQLNEGSGSTRELPINTLMEV